MGQIHILTPEEINNFLSEKRTLFFFMKEKKRLHSDKFDAIGVYNQANAAKTLLHHFKGNADATKGYVTAAITIQNVEYLYKFFVQCNLKQIYLSDLGLISIYCVLDAVYIKQIATLLKHKVDNDCFYWIGFPDGTKYKENDNLCLYLNGHEALQIANKVGGHVASFTIVDPLFKKCFNDTDTYVVNQTVVKGHIIRTACMQHFQETLLPFETIKQYIDQGLNIFAGQNERGEYETFANQGMSTFFSSRADKTLIHPLIQQSFPENSQFFPVEKRESLYYFIDTNYIFIDGMYHCARPMFENAIMGRNDYRQWTNAEMIRKTQELFTASYLYIILSRENFKETVRASIPSIIPSERQRVWLFDDYGKALNFCQTQGRFIDSGTPAIGLLSATTEGWDLHTTLSSLLLIDVQDVEVNPLEDDRMLLSIKFMLDTQQLQPIEKERIKKIQLIESEKNNNDSWIFNDIVLA